MSKTDPNLLSQLDGLNAQQLKRLLVEHLTSRKLGLQWESNAIERDEALNADLPLPMPVPSLHCGEGPYKNLIIEGDNFDSLRLLRGTHRNKIRVIYIDPPYNTGNKDWVYNDSYVGKNDRWRHSQWLEFLYRRLTLARDLLTPDGVILVSINDENRARLELLMEEVFPGRRRGSFVWKTRSGSNDESGAGLSLDHEHILVFGSNGFAFNGEMKDFSQYKNTDNDERGPWKTGDLSKSHSLTERPNGYYPIQNPATGTWYPCIPNRVWAFASEKNRTDPELLRAKSMEQYIREGKVIFPDPSEERVVIWETMDDLLAAIDSGDVPIRPKSKAPLLTRKLPDLAFWVGKPVGFGRPWFKRHLADLKSEVRPISSWIRGAVEDEQLDEFTLGLVAQRSGTGEPSANEILGFNAFSFPKPTSLIRSLLAHATRPGDTVLDFFAGSGTTGHAVLQLNAEDGGNRRFILCSSTEATPKDPDKNLCRDVCAERIRRVIQGVKGQAGFTPEQGGSFAYLQLHKLPPADAAYELTPEQSYAWLMLNRLQAVSAMPSGTVKPLGRIGDCDLLLVPKVNAVAIKALEAWPAEHGCARLAIYCKRPEGLAEALESRGVKANVYGLMDALMSGVA